MASAGLLSVFPSDWKVVSDQSTFERIASGGAAAVIQNNSGVGLEALRLGLPLIDLRNPKTTPNYPYLESSVVNVVSDSDELRNVLAKVSQDEQEVKSRVDVALAWSEVTGREATERVAASVLDAREAATPSELVLDGWAL